MATMEFTPTNIRNMRDAAQKLVNGSISSPTQVTESFLNGFTVLAGIGAAIKRINPEVAFWNAVISKTVSFSNSLDQAQRNKYRDIYSTTYDMMISQGYTRVRMEGDYVNSGAMGSDGVWYTVPVIYGYPRVTGYRLSNGTWILAS